jgi:GNAT superfamily N-acetyltransferase
MMFWRVMKPADLDAVHALADRIHLDHPEDLDVLAERQRLFPPGCQVLERDGVLLGYAISHPWDFGRPPALNTKLERLPPEPTTYYLHDVAIAADARGSGRAAQAVDRLVGVAAAIGLHNVSLVAVNGSQAFWEKHGFVPTPLPGLATKLMSYGGGAVFMVREIGEPARPSRVGKADGI